MAENDPKLPFGLTTGHVITLGGAVAAAIGSWYVMQAKVADLETRVIEVQQILVTQTKVVTAQEDMLRRLHDIERRLDRVEQRQVPEMHSP